MRNWFFLLVIFAFTIAQVTIVNYFRVFGVKPDLILIGVVFAAISSLDFKWVVSLSIFAGILKDAFSAGPFGISVILFPSTSFFVAMISKEIPTDNNIVRAIIIFVSVVFNNILTRLIFLFSGEYVPLSIFLRITFIESLYTAFTAFIILKIYQIRSETPSPPRRDGFFPA